MDQRKFTLRHLRDLGFGKQSMEALINEELNELIDGIRYNKVKRCLLILTSFEAHKKTSYQQRRLNLYRMHVGIPIDLLTRLQLAVLNALWKITCGERYSHDDNRLLNILKKTGAYEKVLKLFL